MTNNTSTQNPALDQFTFAAQPTGTMVERHLSHEGVAEVATAFRYVKVQADKWLLLDGSSLFVFYTDSQMAWTVERYGDQYKKLA